MSNLGVLWAKGNYKNPKPDWFNPFPQWAKQKEAKRLIPQETARLFLRLQRENKVPSWVNKVVDLELFKLAGE